MRAIQITRFGGPEVMELVDLPKPEAPGPGAVLIRVSRSGVNYADTHQTEDSYLSPSTLPMVPGGEVAGTTEDGRRVVAVLPTGGGYAEWALAPEATTYEIPDGVTDAQALALVVQGTTALHMLRSTAHLQQGESVVVHAAAGGVGSLAVQLAKAFGAGRVIGSASSEAKRELALELGADVAIDPNPEGLRDRLIEANEGRRVDIVLEMTGGPVFDESLRALAPFGRQVIYGMASRMSPQPIDAGKLLGTSRAVLGFWLAHCFLHPTMMPTAMAELFELTAAGKLRPIDGGDYPLAEAAEAHRALLERRTTGKLTLDPTR